MRTNRPQPRAKIPLPRPPSSGRPRTASMRPPLRRPVTARPERAAAQTCARATTGTAERWQRRSKDGRGAPGAATPRGASPKIALSPNSRTSTLASARKNRPTSEHRAAAPIHDSGRRPGRKANPRQPSWPRRRHDAGPFQVQARYLTASAPRSTLVITVWTLLSPHRQRHLLSHRHGHAADADVGSETRTSPAPRCPRR